MEAENEQDRLRERMVARQIAARGVRCPRVLEAMRRVPRERFVPARLRDLAYDDEPLPIGGGQTISQPYIVALMIEALGLQGGERVLEIGTGSGYAAAVLSQIAGVVYTVERDEALARAARDRLTRDGYVNVEVAHGDGTLGWPAAAPYDAIVVAAGGPDVPRALREQLLVGGRLVMPVGGERNLQKLKRITRLESGRFLVEDLGDVRFVPLLGAEGWEE